MTENKEELEKKWNKVNQDIADSIQVESFYISLLNTLKDFRRELVQETNLVEDANTKVSWNDFLGKTNLDQLKSQIEALVNDYNVTYEPSADSSTKISNFTAWASEGDMEKKPRDWYIQMQQYTTNYIGEISFALNDKVQDIDVAYEVIDKISSQFNNLNN
ncbi:hypothetical protein [Fructilactobacillus sanfranciscensis]|uniref:hypothetical protein n=1 Tax=Fructilactobacillus sanfranciscensis TaxID=1625 RepID=UPI00111AD65A|nr:hypothetical protein [Fructilactobacillus sanfranciscensis]TNK96721.1 hypothetical protein DKP75_07005 [Fructilactobacillus sanfranciscensis]